MVFRTHTKILIISISYDKDGEAMTKNEWILILLILMVVVLAAELAYIMLRKKRRKEEMFRKKKDPVETVAERAHNLILTIESISRTLANQGINTFEADDLLRQARIEETAKDFGAAVERAEAAKLVLLRLKRESAARGQTSSPSYSDPEKRPMNQSIYNTADTPITATPWPEGEAARENMDLDSLPTNYIQAKFMLNTAKGLLENKEITSGDAFDLYQKAQNYFDQKDYSKALSHAIKAEQLIDSGTVNLIAEETHPDIEEIEIYVCPSCDTEVADDDAFCNECGQNLEEETGCPGCGEPTTANDKFCRKCGEKLK